LKKSSRCYDLDMARTAKPETSRRSYEQYCAVSRALDVVGDRWTLMIVRDLLVGPKRYRDLLDGLPGIGTNLLADRLRQLEADGLAVKRTLPPPAASTVYELTEAGRELEGPVLALGRWGGRFLGPPRPTEHMLPTPFFLAMRAAFRPDDAPQHETFELRIDGRVFEVRFADGRCTTSEGRAVEPDIVLALDVETLYALLFRELDPADAVSSGRVEVVRGDAEAVARFTRSFAFYGTAA
jgi:DNA-binding HxlR family transcriptional regulator/putative sterol carrier protein